jgi:hypothetical protein
VNITGSTLTDNGGNGITLTGNWARIVGNTIVNKGNIGISVFGAWVFVFNNIIMSSVEDGISVIGDNVYISGNTVTNSGGDGIWITGFNAQVWDNKVTGNTGDGIEVTGNLAYIKDNEAHDNGGNGIRVNGDDAAISNNHVSNNGIREHTRPTIPQIDVNGFTQQMTYYRTLLEQIKEAHHLISLDPQVILSEEYWIIPSPIKLMLYGSCSVTELITEILGEIASSFTIKEYCDALNNVYGGDVEVKLTELGIYGNGIYAAGYHAMLYNNTATDNGGYGIMVNGDNSIATDNLEVSGNAGGIMAIGNHIVLNRNHANSNDWVGIYVRDETESTQRFSVINDCDANDNYGIGIVVHGTIGVLSSCANRNKLDGILAIGDKGTEGTGNIYGYPGSDIGLCNGIYENNLDDNGGNGIYSVGNNAMQLNRGGGNRLVGILEYGDPILLAGPNAVEGMVGSAFPPIVQIANLISYFGEYGAVELFISEAEEWLVKNWPN